jgi:hypothetical protein
MTCVIGVYNQPVTVNGIELSPTIRLRVFLGDFLCLIVGARYEYELLFVGHDGVSTYPRGLSEHNFSLSIGLGILTAQLFRHDS